MALPRILTPFQSRNYRFYFSGQILSLTGNWMTQTATVWVVYEKTASPSWLGAVTFCSLFPSLILGPAAGVWIDRWDKLRLLKATQALGMLQSFALAGLALWGKLSLFWLLALAFFQGCINAFDLPVRQALAVALVEKREHLAGVIGLNSSMFNLSRLAGPAIAGFVIAAYGAGFCFLIDGLSYLAVLGALSAMRLTLYRREKSRGLSVAQEFHEGLRYAWGFGPIRLLIFLMGCFSFFGMSYGVLVPVYAATVFSGDARVLGWMMSSSAAGALAGALFLAGRRELAGIGKCIRVGAVLLGISLLGFAFSRHLGLSCLLLVGAGLGVVLTAASSNTLVQNLVDEDKRGRVMSLYTLAFMGGMPLGSLLVGAAAEHAGATAATCLNGTACLVLAYVFFTHLPKIRAEAVAVLQSKGLMPS